MYAFSQTPSAYLNERSRAQETLELGEEFIGFVNETRYQDYRYFQANMSATYDIRLTRIPGYGKPVFFVKIMDSGSGFFPRNNNNHFSSQADPVKPVSV
jgi:hypothetical protein